MALLRPLCLGKRRSNRGAKPDGIGDVVAFLASDAATWITGDAVKL